MPQVKFLKFPELGFLAIPQFIPQNHQLLSTQFEFETQLLRRTLSKSGYFNPSMPNDL
jgi:hypothetical protein